MSEAEKIDNQRVQTLNEAKRTKIGCTIRPFDCANYKHEHLCNLYETDCEYATKLNGHVAKLSF
uniref:Uncharacterized protein n=1 Tax=viral metagenome TaxID=1070528 RepID=A0A6M3J5F1_9ZZZZ